MQVRAKTHTGGRESRQQAIVKVMVDLLLDMEGISLSQGLVYVLDGLKSYPVSGIRGWVKFSKPFGPDVEETSEDGVGPLPGRNIRAYEWTPLVQELRAQPSLIADSVRRPPFYSPLPRVNVTKGLIGPC